MMRKPAKQISRNIAITIREYTIGVGTQNLRPGVFYVRSHCNVPQQINTFSLGEPYKKVTE